MMTTTCAMVGFTGLSLGIAVEIELIAARLRTGAHTLAWP